MGELNIPTHSNEVKASIPSPHILLVSLNRPKALNAMSSTMSADMKRLLDWFEGEPELWVVVLTGEGRLFCAGADLIEWNKQQQGGDTSDQGRVAANRYGFGSVSRRESTKPIIAAVHGGAYGGGLEMVVNSDLVIASEDAKFGFPEVTRGVIAIQGAIPRITQICGHQKASELLLTGKIIGAVEARDRFGFVNAVVPNSTTAVAEAIKLAQQITANSPDAVQSTKHALVLSQRLSHSETVSQHVWSHVTERVYNGQNIKEGLKAFAEKRRPIWTNPSKL
ncbi:ClpP/crotonase-like domain-containing protein [Crepidotus variabilis]|uniref:ClpP/crotonase-like domain-containing protein n=1 Tax=Crepidotus variabilis TaxID=179855 RepID=A0A9P6EFT5_9AGAR|nr:ClpP/crotonase-like domain-containing protein [Crepidotus variabilis]